MGQSRVENILEATIAGSSYADGPQSRLEALLLQLKEVIEQGGGGTPSASDVSYDNTTSGLTADDVQEAIDEVFQSVSSGKTLVAGAITDKGVTTSASDTFATMATNIAAIPSAVEGEVVVNWYSGWVGTKNAQERSYTATERGKLYVSVLSGALQIQMTGWDIPRAYLNNVEQTALTSGGGKWDNRYTTGSYYATYAINMDEDDVALITAIPATPSSDAGRVAFIYAVFVSASSTPSQSDFYIMDPDIIDSVYNGGLNSYSPILYAEKIQGGDSRIRAHDFTGYNNNICLRMDYLGNHCIGFMPKIPKEVSKIQIAIGVTTNTYGQYNSSHVFISTSPIPSDINVPGGTLLKYFAITDYAASGPSDINNQTGITINSSNKYVLDYQTVEIDVSDLTVDSYIYFHNCDCYVFVRSIKCVY